MTFNPETEGKDIKYALDYFQHQLKGISFLPQTKNVYQQMPYEEITMEEYIKRKDKLGKLCLDLDVNYGQAAKDKEEDAKPETYCDSDKCQL